jgi:hypothetical protein
MGNDTSVLIAIMLAWSAIGLFITSIVYHKRGLSPWAGALIGAACGLLGGILLLGPLWYSVSRKRKRPPVQKQWYCALCGKPVREISKFCPYCGKPVVFAGPMATVMTASRSVVSKHDTQLLDDSVGSLVKHGWKLKDRTEATALIVKLKPFNILWLWLFWLVYIIYWTVTREREHFIEVKEGRLYFDGLVVSQGRPICVARKTSAPFVFAVFLFILTGALAAFVVIELGYGLAMNVRLPRLLSAIDATLRSGFSREYFAAYAVLGFAIVALILLVLSISYFAKAARWKAENARLSSRYTLINSDV